MVESDQLFLDPEMLESLEDAFGTDYEAASSFAGGYDSFRDFHKFIDASAAAAAAADAADVNKASSQQPGDIFRNGTGRDAPEEIVSADQILSQEFEKLQMHEKDKVLFEIHGIDSCDDPENIDQYFAELERHLTSIEDKKWYEAAKYYDPEYVKNQRIGFLRSVRFDPKTAAEKMVTHFDTKQSIFGDGEILGREIRYSDLSEGDREMLESGFMQILPFRDAAGRSIVFTRPELQERADNDRVRAVWYLLSTTLQDEETSKKGVVFVMFANSPSFIQDIEALKQLHTARNSLPKKLVGVHGCSCDPDFMQKVAKSGFAFMTKEMAVHFRPHIASTPREIAFELQTFGIPITEEHLSVDSTVPLAWHREWLAIRKRNEQESAESPKGVVVPKKFDVLYGRGKQTREHTGNLRLNLIVEMHMQQYEAATKPQKTLVSERIVAMVHEALGRFLKYDADKGWVEVSNDEAREKVAHNFRFQRSQRAANAKTAPDSAPSQAQSGKRVTPCASPSIASQQEPKRQDV